MTTISVNGVRQEVQAPGDTPLLYVLRNDLQLIGPQFGCGLAQCGACAVLVDGKEVRSCITPLSQALPTRKSRPWKAPREVGKAKRPLAGGSEETRFTPSSKRGSKSRLRNADFARTE